MSVRVVLDLLDQLTNTRVLSLFHNRMWQSRYSEVNVHLVQHWLLVTWLVTCVTANNGFPRSIMCCFIFNVETLAVIRWTCLGSSCFNNGLPRSIGFDSFFVKRTCIDLLGTGRFSSTLRGPWVAPDNGLLRSIMGLDLVGSIGNFWIVEQLVRPVVEQLLNPILSSNHVSRRSLEEAEVIQKLSLVWLLRFPS